MSVVNSFSCNDVKINRQLKRVYILTEDGRRDLFNFDIECTAVANVSCYSLTIRFFFSIKNNKSLIVYRNRYDNDLRHCNAHCCSVMKFCIEKDLPVMSANWLELIESFRDEWKDKYAAYLIDEVINA